MAKSRRRQEAALQTPTDINEFSDNDLVNSVKIKKLNIKFRTEAQEKFWNLMGEKEISFCAGPAGTGKTHLAVAKSLDLISREDTKCKRIILVKPVVEADEKLGALPGDVEEKLEPYTYATFYLFEKMLGKRKLEKLIERGYIRVMALAYMRGVNIDNSVLLFEEAQNSTKKQMKTLLTRIGENCKFIINGDHEQSDRYKDHKDSGLYFAMDKLTDIPEIGIFEFKSEDIVRNPVISKILKKFNGDV